MIRFRELTALAVLFALFLTARSVGLPFPLPGPPNLNTPVKRFVVGGRLLTRSRTVTEYEDRVMITNVDVNRKRLYYGTLTGVVFRTRSGYTYGTACSSDYEAGTMGQVIWSTNVTTLNELQQDGHGHAMTLLPNASSLAYFVRYPNPGIGHMVFGSRTIEYLNVDTGRPIAQQPVDPRFPNQTYFVPLYMFPTRRGLGYAYDNGTKMIAPGFVPLQDYVSAQSYAASVKGDALLQSSSFGGDNPRQTLFSTDPFTGTVTSVLNVTRVVVGDSKLAIDKDAGHVYIAGSDYSTPGKYSITKLSSNGRKAIWTQNYTAEFLVNGTTRPLETGFKQDAVVRGITVVSKDGRIVIGCRISYPDRYGTGNAVNQRPPSKVSVPNPRVQVSRQTKFGPKDKVVAVPVAESKKQQEYGVNTADILILVISATDGRLVSARLVGTPFTDSLDSVEYAGNGLLALFGRFPTVYTQNPARSRDYPVYFDTTDVGSTIGSIPKR